MEKIRQNKLITLVIVLVVGVVIFNTFNTKDAVNTDTQQPLVSEEKSTVATPKPVETETVEEKVVEIPEPVKVEAKLAIYEIVEEEDISYAGCERLAIRVVMDDDATQADAKLTVKTIAEKYSNWDEVTVWGWSFSERSEVGASMFTKGMYEAGSCN